MGQENWLSILSAGAASELEPLLGCCCCLSCVLAETKLRNIAIMEPERICNCRQQLAARERGGSCPSVQSAASYCIIREAFSKRVLQTWYVLEPLIVRCCRIKQSITFPWLEKTRRRSKHWEQGELMSVIAVLEDDLNKKHRSIKHRSCVMLCPHHCQISAFLQASLNAHEQHERPQQMPSTRTALWMLESRCSLTDTQFRSHEEASVQTEDWAFHKEEQWWNLVWEVRLSLK